MARIQIKLPEHFVFDTVLEVRVSDINYGNHMANDAFLRFAHEARVRFLQAHGYSEMDVEGRGIIMSDAAVCYKAEVFHGTPLRMRIGLADISNHGFDIIYQAVDDNSGKEVARLKTGIVFFDYDTRKIASTPERFRSRFQAEQLGAP